MARAVQRLRNNQPQQCLEDCKAALREQPHHRQALELSALAAFRAGDLQAALDASWTLVEAYPNEPMYCDRLAQLAERGGKPEEGSRAYENLLSRRPAEVITRFNHARLLRTRGLNEQALEQYQRCLADGIHGPEEVHSNMGVIFSDMHRTKEAENAFRDALAQKPDYIPALYNLALLLEERGDWPEASGYYAQVLELDPFYQEAAARLVHGQLIESVEDPALQAVSKMLDEPTLAPQQRESLYYALAKGLDDCAHYRDAFTAYREANNLSLQRVPAYDPKAQDSLVERLLQAPVLANLAPVSDRPLVFIFGMFRSGSTLLEQMLAGHAELQSGGEIGFISGRAKLPAWTERQFGKDWEALAQEYLNHLDTHFPGERVVLDKRPDNLFYLPMLMRLFPAARFIHTTRQAMDNCLAVYFQQLGGDFAYANQLSDIAHYLQSQQRLISALAQDGAERIHTVPYEALVTDTRQTLAACLDFLGLGWDEQCLDHTSRDTRVRTASVSQVRRPIYTSSVNRWQNYEDELRQSALFPDLMG